MNFCPEDIGNWSPSPQNDLEFSPISIRSCFPLLRGPSCQKNHRQRFFDPTELQSPIGSPSWIKKSADGDFLQLGPWKSVKQLWIDRSSRKLQLILRRGRSISKISEAKAHANVLKGTFSTDCKSNCLRTGQSTY